MVGRSVVPVDHVIELVMRALRIDDRIPVAVRHPPVLHLFAIRIAGEFEELLRHFVDESVHRIGRPHQVQTIAILRHVLTDHVHRNSRHHALGLLRIPLQIGARALDLGHPQEAHGSPWSREYTFANQLHPRPRHFERRRRPRSVIKRTLLCDPFEQMSGDADLLLRRSIAANHRRGHLHVGVVLCGLNLRLDGHFLAFLQRLDQLHAQPVRDIESERGLLIGGVRTESATQIVPRNLVGAVNRLASRVVERHDARRAKLTHCQIVDRSRCTARQHNLAGNLLVRVVLLVLTTADVNHLRSDVRSLAAWRQKGGYVAIADQQPLRLRLDQPQLAKLAVPRLRVQLEPLDMDVLKAILLGHFLDVHGLAICSLVLVGEAVMLISGEFHDVLPGDGPARFIDDRVDDLRWEQRFRIWLVLGQHQRAGQNHQEGK